MWQIELVRISNRSDTWKAKPFRISYSSGVSDLLWRRGKLVRKPYKKLPRRVVKLHFHQAFRSIPCEAFYNSPNLKKVVLCEGLQVIGNASFSCCHLLERINIPSTVISIKPRAFLNCTRLKKVDLCEGLQSLGRHAFTGCRNLKEIKVPSSVINLNKGTFANCNNLVKVELNEGLRTIGDAVFWSCGSLESINIPSSLESIGNDNWDEFFYHSRRRSQCAFHIFSTALCDTSTINSIYLSNHNLTSIGLDLDCPHHYLTGYERERLSDILELNRIPDKHVVAAIKIIRYHGHLSMESMFQWGLKCLPLVLDRYDKVVVFSENVDNIETKKLDSMYQLLRESPPVLVTS